MSSNLRYKIFLIAYLLMLSLLRDLYTSGSFFGDYRAAHKSVCSLEYNFSDLKFGHFPLGFNFLRFLTKTFGCGESSIKLISNFLFLLLSMVMYILFTSVGDGFVSLLSVVLTSLYPLVFTLSGSIDIDFIFVVYVFLSLYYFVKRNYPKAFFLAVFSVLVKIYGSVFFISILAYYVFLEKSAKNKRANFVVFKVSLLFALLMFLYTIKLTMSDKCSIPNDWKKYSHMMLSFSNIYSNFNHLMYISGYGNMILITIFKLFVLISLAQLKNCKYRIFSFLLVVSLLLFSLIGTMIHRHFLIIYPLSFFIVLTFFNGFISRMSYSRYIMLALFTIIATLFFYEGFYTRSGGYEFIDDNISSLENIHEMYERTRNFIMRNFRPDDTIFLSDPYCEYLNDDMHFYNIACFSRFIYVDNSTAIGKKFILMYPSTDYYRFSSYVFSTPSNIREIGVIYFKNDVFAFYVETK